MDIRLVSVTKIDECYLAQFDEPEFKNNINNSGEALIAYIARVSSPNQTNTEYANLISYCIKNGHWSILEHVHVTFEIVTTRMISPQILRHRSFTYQEFSQRYSKLNSDAVEIYEARRQADKNRQSSVDNLDESIKFWWRGIQKEVWDFCWDRYEEAIEKGIASECARAILPLNTKTRLFMTGSIRSWVHYLAVRTKEDVQKEHRDIAVAIQNKLSIKYPIISSALNWHYTDV